VDQVGPAGESRQRRERREACTWAGRAQRDDTDAGGSQGLDRGTDLPEREQRDVVAPRGHPTSEVHGLPLGATGTEVGQHQQQSVGTAVVHGTAHYARPLQSMTRRDEREHRGGRRSWRLVRSLRMARRSRTA
jgi:hypothetical protein